MLIGLTVAEPSAMPEIGSRPGEVRRWSRPGLVLLPPGMPSALAILRILSGPSGIDSVRSTYAVFTDSSVAVIMLIAAP